MGISYIFLILSLIIWARSQEVQQGINNLLDRMAFQYEQVSERNGRFLFLKYKHAASRTSSRYPPLYNDKLDQYDFIIVGSGAAGSVIANRLSENPNWKILLLEAGKEPSIITDIPAIASTLQFTDFNWGYLMEKQQNVCLGMEEQRMSWPRGKALGGSSVINFMIHVRGNRLDYDRWGAAGNPGWFYKDVLPYFKRMEDSTVEQEDPGFHNRGGPISVQDVSFRSDASRAFIQGTQELGYKYVDYNGKQQMGVSYVQATTRRGTRCSVEKGYLRQAIDRPNLTILTLSRAVKIIINDQNQATGVQYVRNRQYHTAKATKEVILSAGAFNSPQLLMLSGIGPQSHLEELGIPTISNLPVGQTMYDHLTYVGLVFSVNETIAIEQSAVEDPRSTLQLVVNGTGPLTTLGGVEALAYIKTPISRDKDMYPDVELIFLAGSLHTDRGLVLRKSIRMLDSVYNAIWKPLEGKPAWSIIPMLLHPYSKGYLKLKSRNPYHWPKLYGNFFTDPENLDVQTLIAAIREVQKISNSPAFQKYGSTQVKTAMPGCELHVYDTDQYWECALRHIASTLHHQTGTCKMGPPEDVEAVVDHTLKVYGIAGLRVADSSIIPVPLSAHTNTPTIMVGEKASDLIKQAWAHETIADYLY